MYEVAELNRKTHSFEKIAFKNAEQYVSDAQDDYEYEDDFQSSG